VDPALTRPTATAGTNGTRARITGAKELTPLDQHHVRLRASLIRRIMLTIRVGKRMLLAGTSWAP
jgi:hypothetical protein